MFLVLTHYLQTLEYKKKLQDVESAEKDVKKHGADTPVKGSSKGSKNSKQTYGAILQHTMDREVQKWKVATVVRVIAQINMWSDEVSARGHYCLFIFLVWSLRCLAGGHLQTWWRLRAIDQFLFPPSPASIDVSSAKAAWAKMVSGLTQIPRKFKKGERVDAGGGKIVVRSSRGDLPVGNQDAVSPTPGEDEADDGGEYQEGEEGDDESDQ